MPAKERLGRPKSTHRALPQFLAPLGSTSTSMRRQIVLDEMQLDKRHTLAWLVMQTGYARTSIHSDLQAMERAGIVRHHPPRGVVVVSRWSVHP